MGESTLAQEGRRHLTRLGLPKERIAFSGFWRHPASVAA
ncbi:siderophore-interacting protein [Streptomyces sp. NBC_01578]|nr:siderophore-interacting protein [Streptomyces sp. NBC_00562]